MREGIQAIDFYSPILINLETIIPDELANTKVHFTGKTLPNGKYYEYIHIVGGPQLLGRTALDDKMLY